MKKIILSITLIMSLLITSCSTSGGTASSENSETTTAITTTTEETTTTEATTTQPKQAVCSLADLCDLMASALGKELDESSAFLEEALGTNFIFTKTDRHEAGEDGYEKTTCFSYYDCDIVADGYQFITICFDYSDDNIVDTISFTYNPHNSTELKNGFEFFKAAFLSLFGEPINEYTDYSFDITIIDYRPQNGIYYSIMHSDMGNDHPNTGTLLSAYLEQ